MRLVAGRETRRRRFRHPCRQAGERAVRLKNDDELDAAALEPSPDLHHFAEARVEPVADTSFSRLFVALCSHFEKQLDRSQITCLTVDLRRLGAT